MRLSISTFAFLCVLAAAWSTCFAQDQEFTNRRDVFQDEAVRRDFTIQGEYIAKMDNYKVGLQLIADGGGKFRVVSYPGGLPGDGWKAGQPRLLGTAEVDGDSITFNMTEGRGESKDGKEIKMPEKVEAKGKIQMDRPQGGPGQGGQRGQGGQGGQGMRNFRGFPVKIDIPLGDKNPALLFEKQFRESPTLGEKAPAGALVIFDGTNVNEFEPGAKMNESPRGNTLWSEATTKAFEKKPYKLHLEFLLSYMPTAHGQARSNSGVYIDQNYECQVLDSFGLEGENNECGGFYQVSKPAVNMCFPPLTWQTYDFDFTPAKYDGDNKIENARITVKHNGVVIHDNIELPKETPGCLAEGPAARGLYLQGHGNKVQYRNIWLQYK